MTGTGTTRRKVPNLATRTVIMLVAAAIVSAFGLVVVDLVTRPVPPGAVAVQPEPGEEKMPLNPEVGEGLGELALQLALVAGIAFAGRRILKIRL